ncbi:zinc fingers and homeoboxes protein 3 [Pseudorasbora parva]|uniref:zinc fingers and homeoboxes protein 3 n=1 Tax=Pseudorasbora parva TaxID=51549 RepID=UPI00351F5D7F
MASKRKSTVPCMIPVKTMHLQDDFQRDRLSPPTKDIGFSFREVVASAKGCESLGESSRQDTGDIHKDGDVYTCKPCNFETQDLNLFLDHVYSGHPDFRIDPCFLCVDCGVSAAKFEGLALHNARVHPSTITTTLQLKKKDNRLMIEQSLCIEPCESTSSKETEISITKTPIMKMLKGKSEPKRIVVSHSATDDPPPSVTKAVGKNDSPAVTVTHVPTIVHSGAASKVAVPSAIQIVNGSGALPMLKTAVTQVVSVVQNTSLNQHSAPVSSSHSSSTSTKNLPKVMIPLSSIPTYNASMDNSSFLKTSFSKFPYPTKAELCYLTVVTRYPEEQIKIWFTAQRLKQGISWSPEEIEDARRKMFNTIIQAAPNNSQQQRQTQHTATHPTITVLGTTAIPHILQGSLVGQGGVIVTQPMMANGIQVSSAPVALAVTPKPQAAAKPTMQARPAAALVADKGISMVLGTVGSSSSGNCSSSSSASASSSSSISSTSSLCSQASVISVGGSSTAKLNNNSNVKVNAPGTNGACVQSNGNIVKSEGKGNSEAKSNINSKSNVSSASATPTTTVASTTSTDSTIPGKSDSPCPISMSSRSFSSANFLDPSFNKTKKSQGQLAALKESFLVSQFPDQEEVDRLISLTGLTVREVRKWFSDRRYHFRNLKGSRSSGGGGQTVTASGSVSQLDTLAAVDLSENSTPPERPKTPQQSPLSPSQTASPPTPTRRPPRPPSPDFTAIRYKEREPHQVRALEASFAQDPDPSSEEVDRLRAETKMTRREIHSWFAERRKRVAAEKKKEEAAKAEREDADAVGEEEMDGIQKEKTSNEETHEAEDSSMETQEVKEEKQRDESGTEPKVNPIKINLKMLKVTESNGKGEPEGGQLIEGTKMPQSISQTSPYRGKKTPEQLHLLKQVFARTHWPSSPQYNELIAKTGLPRPEVVRWFGDCRYVLKNGQLKWLESYQTMVDEEDFQKASISVLKEHLDTHGKLDETKLEEIAKSSGLGEESIRRWFANKMPLLSEERNSENTGSSSATPTEAALTPLNADHEDVKVEQSGSSLISKDQTAKSAVEISTNT